MVWFLLKIIICYYFLKIINLNHFIFFQKIINFTNFAYFLIFFYENLLYFNNAQ